MIKNSSKVLGILKTFFQEGFKAEGKNEKKHIAASGYDIDDLAVLLRGSVRQTGREQLAGRSDGACRNVGRGDCSACGDGFCRIASLGGEYYVGAEMLTDVLPASAEELMRKTAGCTIRASGGLSQSMPDIRARA